jgi:hypothetical protein
MNTGQSEVEDPSTCALPSAADPEVDLEAQPGTARLPGTSSHYCLRPFFHWALSRIV